VKAAVCREFGVPLSIEDVTLDPPGPGEVRVELAACAICHSDITFARGGWGGALPAVYGHEAAGVVAEIGDGVDRVEVGRHVVVTLIRSCGRCAQCRRGHEVACTSTWPLDHRSPLSDADGVRLHHGMRTAAFAEQVVVEQSQIVAIDDDIPLDSACLLACGVITGFGAVTNTADVGPGDIVVVIGCGGVGLNSVQGAATAGATIVIAVDLSAEKLRAAVDFGATAVVNAVSDDVKSRVHDLTGGAMADYVFVTVGAKSAFDQAPALLAPFGAVVWVGMPASGVTSELDPATMASRNQRVLGSKMGSSKVSADIPALVSLYRQGRVKLDELITHRFALDQINEAIQEVERGETLRNVIIFDLEP